MLLSQNTCIDIVSQKDLDGFSVEIEKHHNGELKKFRGAMAMV